MEILKIYQSEEFGNIMKALFVANTDWYLYNFRRSLARFLFSQGWEIVMVSPSGSYTASLEKLGYRWVNWEVGRQTLAPFQELSALNDLRRIYLQEKPDLVHHFTVKPVLYGSIAARLAHVPGIVDCVTGLGYIFLSADLKARLIRPLAKSLYWLTLRASNCRVIFENEGDRGYFLRNRLVQAVKSHLIAGVGVDVEYFTVSPEPADTPIVLFPARMLWDKGVGVLVEAARILHARQMVRIVLVGMPDPGNPTSVDEAMLRRWEQEKLVEYWGWQEDMKAVYQQSHIVTLPSMYEGVPTALLEAAACGKPLVATDIPGCRAVVKDGVNGYLVPVHDSQALADTLEKLIIDASLRQKMGIASRQLIVEQFTDTYVNEATWAVYRELIR
jgi:glycosyltransferase involved in cell wall biosynthesis